MKKIILIMSLALLLTACGGSSDDYKYYSGVRVERNGSVSPLGDELDAKNLPKSYHKIYFRKDGTINKEYYMLSGDSKRISWYFFDKNKKVTEVKYFVGGKYNGVSKFVYDSSGNIEKEDLFDKNGDFMFSKKFEA